MPNHTNSQRSHALVIGGSLSGLLTARVLSDHYEKVTLIDRDVFPDGPEFRNGVPQSRHLHILLLKGLELFEGYFPGFKAELEEAGAISADIGNEFFYDSIAGVLNSYRNGLMLVFASRNLIEWKVRERLKQRGNVQIVSQTDVVGLLADDNRDVCGVKIRARGGTGDVETISANLVVDASGRVSKTPEWLTELGYPSPEMTVVNSHLGYATRWYKQPANYNASWKGLLVNVKPPHNARGGGLFPSEGGLWVVTLAGNAGLYPPTDEEGFLEFARQLSSPVIYDAIRAAEPVSQIYGYRRTENQWRHYEKLTRLPGGLVVIGDAACCFNPIYGQGMTSAAMGARLLDDQLRAKKEAFSSADAKAFQTRLAEFLQTPWLISTGEDFRWDNTEGDRPGGASRIVQGYLDRVIKLSINNPHAQKAFFEVIHLLKPPTSLFQPSIFFRAIFQKP